MRILAGNVRRTAAAVLALLCIGATAVLAWPVGSPAGAASTTSRTAQTSYQCQFLQNGSRNPTSTQATTLQWKLDVPASVKPGDRVLLRGELTIAMSSSTAQMAKGLVTSGQGYSDDMSLQVGVNGQQTVFRANRWQTPQEKVGDGPIIVRAPVSFPPLTVPAGARDTLSLTMARDNVTKNSYSDSPDMLAWTADTTASGPSGSMTFKLACYIGNGNPSVLAKIPVTNKAASAPAGAQAGGAAPANTGGAQAQAPAAAPGAAAPAAPGAAAGAKPAASAAASGQARVAGSPGAAVQPGTTPTAAAPEHGTYVPTGALLSTAAVVVLCSLMYAGWAHYRLRIIRDVSD